MLLDLDVPQALDALLLAVVVPLVAGRVVLIADFGDAQGEKREGEQLKGVFGGGAVVDFGEEGVLSAGFLVGGGVEGANGAFDCLLVRCGSWGGLGCRDGLPLNMSLRFSSCTTVRGFRSCVLSQFATARASGLGGPGWMGCCCCCCWASCCACICACCWAMACCRILWTNSWTEMPCFAASAASCCWICWICSGVGRSPFGPWMLMGRPSGSGGGPPCGGPLSCATSSLILDC